MKSQQAAEKEEQQRIKNLVLNYDLRDGEEQDGELIPYSPIPRNPNIHTRNAGLERAAALNYARLDKSGNNRSGQRARKLQLSDVDWYAKPKFSHVERGNVSPAGGGFEISSTPRSPAMNSANITPRGSRTQKSGKLTRKEMLRVHAALKAENK